MSSYLLPPHPEADIYHQGLSCCDPSARRVVEEWMAELCDAASAYVAARIANDGAEPRDWSARAAEVDRTWHDLLEASGLAMPEVST